MISKYSNGIDIVEAVQFYGNFEEIENFVGGDAEFREGKLVVATKDGPLRANNSEYIVKVGEGKFIACDREEFKSTHKEIRLLVIKSEADIKSCREAQSRYCKETQAPHFAPGSGQCWTCHRNIYQNHGWNIEGESYMARHVEVRKDGEYVRYVTGISLEKAGTQLVTGCPHCNRSYCD